MLSRLALAAAFACSIVHPSFAQTASIATIEKRRPAATEFDFNEVYGTISFQVGTPFKMRADGSRQNYQRPDIAALEALKSLAGTLNKLFGRSKGSYVITLTVTNATTGKEISKAPILAVSSDVQQILFFEKSREELFSLTQEQTLRDYIPIDDANNRFAVKLEAISSDSLSLDLTVLRKLVEAQGQIAGLANLPVSSSADVVIGSFEGVLKAIFDSQKRTVSQNTLEMAFIKRGAPDAASSAEAVLKTHFQYGGEQVNVEPTYRYKLQGRANAAFRPTGAGWQIRERYPCIHC